MREVIERFDFCAYPLVFLAVFVLARNAIRFRPRFAPAMVWTAVAVFLAVAGYGYGEYLPPHGGHLLAILVTAGIAACCGALIVFVILAPFTALADQHAKERERREQDRRMVEQLNEVRQKAELERQRLALEQEQVRADRHAREEWQRLHPPPSPPTREERAAVAKAQFHETLRMIAGAGLDPTEDRAAHDEAKRQYLRELDAIWKRA